MTDAPHDDRRNFYRILFDAPVAITTGELSYHSTLLDISLSGALVAIPEDWSVESGTEVALDIELSEDTHIRMEAEVAHIDTDKLGFHCRHIDMDSISHLRRLVELNLGDEKLLERELNALG